MAIKHSLVRDASYVWLQSELDGGLVTSTVLFPIESPMIDQRNVLSGIAHLIGCEVEQLIQPPIFFNFNKPPGDRRTKIDWIKHVRLNTRLPNNDYIDIFTAKMLVEKFGTFTDIKVNHSTSYNMIVSIERLVSFMNEYQDIILQGRDGRDRFKRIILSY